MNAAWQITGQMNRGIPAATLPPAAIEESCWDVLLALHSDRRCELSLSKLASLTSVSEPALRQRLAALERRRLISGEQHRSTGEIRAVLTLAGRKLLDRYLSATSELQLGFQH